jgi:hypothetical protein
MIGSIKQIIKGLGTYITANYSLPANIDPEISKELEKIFRETLKESISQVYYRNLIYGESFLPIVKPDNQDDFSPEE